MGKSSGSTNTVTQVSQPPSQFESALSNLIPAVEQTASTPYENYSGQIVAPLSSQQTAGVNEVSGLQGAANPYISQAGSYIGASTTPLASEMPGVNAATIAQYENPYTSQVVQSTESAFANTNQQQAQSLTGNQVAQGAYGGDRAAVGQGVLAGQQQASEAPVLASLESTGYTTALGEANTEQQATLGANEANAWLNSQAGFGEANLGNEAENTGLEGANALISAGGLTQQEAQENLNVPYEEFLAQEAYPFQTQEYETNELTNLAAGAGGTGTTTYPGASIGSEIEGGALTAAGVGSLTGAFGSNGYLTSALSGLGGSSSALGSLADTEGLSSGALESSADMGLDFAMDSVRRGGRIPKRGGGGFLSGLGDFLENASAISPIPLGFSAQDENDFASVLPMAGSIAMMMMRRGGIVPGRALGGRAPRFPHLGVLAPALRSHSGGLAGPMGPRGPSFGRARAYGGGVMGYQEGGDVYATPNPADPLAGLPVPMWAQPGTPSAPLSPVGAPTAAPTPWSAYNPPGGRNDMLAGMPGTEATLGTAAPAQDVPVALAGTPVRQQPATTAASAPRYVATPKTNAVLAQLRGTGAPPTPATAAAPSAESQLTAPDATLPDGLAKESGTKAKDNVEWGKLLLYTGLGIMGGRSPQAAVNVGQGGLEGLKLYESDRERQQQAEWQQQYRQEQADTNRLYRQQMAANTANRNQTYAEVSQARSQELQAQATHLMAAAAMAGVQKEPPVMQTAKWLMSSNPDLTPEQAVNIANGAATRLQIATQSNTTRQQIAERAAQLRQQGLDEKTANDQATLEVRQRGQDQSLLGQNPQAAPLPRVMAGTAGAPATAPPQSALEPGKTIWKGYMYQGGPPGLPQSWAPVQQPPQPP